MKNASKNKFLTCFRPVVDIDDMLESEAISDRSATPKTRANRKIGHSQTCFGSRRSYSARTRTSSSTTGVEKSTVRLASLTSNVKEMKAVEISWSSSSSSKSVSLEKKKKFQRCCGIYVVLINLIVTVIWGKNSVIILTSILFCCFCLWNASYRRQKGVAMLSNTQSKVEKNVHSGH